MKYDVVCTTVTDRNDLFVASMESLLEMADQPPAAIIVNEDTREGEDNTLLAGVAVDWLRKAQAAGRIEEFVHRQVPAAGMGPGVVWAMEQAAMRNVGPFVLFTQEDWEFVRPTPISRCMDIMDDHELHHVRFNKRATMAAKHADTDNPWHKREVSFDLPEGDSQVLCVSDHWYTQASLWRVSKALPGLRAVVKHNPTAHAFVPAFNYYMNVSLAPKEWGWTFRDKRYTSDVDFRQEYMRTYIYGPIGERRYIQHLGSSRGTGPVKNHHEA